MRYLLALLLVFLLASFGKSWQMCFAQNDTVNIKLSEGFLKALEGAFSFEQLAAPLPKQNDLTVEQLHEWVGRPTATDTARNAGKFDETYKALKMWEKEFYVPVSLRPTSIPINIGPLPRPNASVSLDVNKLGEYLRPKEIRLRKLRKKTAEVCADLDSINPLIENSR